MHRKKNTNRRILSWLLASSMMFVLLPTFVAGAASDEPQEAVEPAQEVSIVEDTDEPVVMQDEPELVEAAEANPAAEPEEAVIPAPEVVCVPEPVPVYTDPTESIAEMEATLPRHLTGSAAEKLVAVACSQIGYRPADAGYSRYVDWCVQYAQWWIGGAQMELSSVQWNVWLDAWAGMDAYSAWNAPFAAFCLYYAGVEIEKLPIMPTAESWAPVLQELGLYRGSDYTPKAGDLIFLDRHIGSEYAEEQGFVGIVTWADSDELWAVIGDYDGEALCMAISPYDYAIIGYAVLPVEEEVVVEEITETHEELIEKFPEEPTEEAIEEAIEERAEEPTEEPTEEPIEELELAEAPIDDALENIVTLDGETFTASYAMAPEGYVLICRPNDLPEGMTYIIDDTAMLYTTEDAYTSGQLEGVFIALVPADAPAVIEAVESERTELAFNCDINGDGVLNIADANAVYQMAVNGGDYYSVDQIGLKERLSLCYQSIEDLDRIVDIINGGN